MNEHDEYLRLLRLLRLELDKASELEGSLPEELDVQDVEITEADRELVKGLRERILNGEIDSIVEEIRPYSLSGSGFDRRTDKGKPEKDPFAEIREELWRKVQEEQTGDNDERRKKSRDS